MPISSNAKEVLSKRYLTRDENGEVVETIEGMFRRVSDAIAAADTKYNSEADIKALSDQFYTMMTDLDFLPNSPTLMNAGKELGQLSACFVLPIGDSMEEIFETIKQAALIHKSGGGTGFSFSRLRASGSQVRSTGGVASGPVSFMRVFNMATEAVKQGGTRRGANMGILRVDHPDIQNFITCKSDNADITNFNISVGVTEEFMRAVEAGENYNLIDPKTKQVVGELSAPEVFESIVSGAWHNGEPGIIFLDRLNRDNVVPSQGEIESTNPCGEQPLLPYESCNLGSINLDNMLTKKGKKYEVNWKHLAATVHKAVHFLDNVIEVNRYPLEAIEETTKQTRKVGLGVMGFSDMLLRLGIPYNSDEGVKMGAEVMKFINDESHKATQALAKVRGAFPLFGESIFKDGPEMRNATTTTIAPTGTLSIIASCSSGVEPIFAYAYFRRVMDNTLLAEVNPILEEALRDRGLYTAELMEKIANEGTLAHIDEIPDDIKRVFVSSHDISPLYHIKMQAAFQQHTDNAVSKTVNFTNEATQEEVREVFLLAYQLDCKGVTIYRDGSRQLQVLNVGKAEEEAGAENAETTTYRKDILPRPRPEITRGITEKVRIGCGNLYITVNYDDEGICEIFTSTGKAGGCPSQSEAAARLASIALRSGVKLEEIVGQLRGIRCPSTIRQSNMRCTSCPDAIARVIERVYKEIGATNSGASSLMLPALSTRPTMTEVIETGGKMKYCPECGQTMEQEGGCVTCRLCGYSKCN